jgi:hypothetical protein
MDKLRNAGFSPAPMPGGEFQAYMASEKVKWAKIVTDSKATLD